MESSHLVQSEGLCCTADHSWPKIRAGFATMWNGLEEAAKNIGKSVASETVTTVKYK